MLKTSIKNGKVTPTKKTITIDGINLSKSTLVDETGDVTQQFINELPSGIDIITLKTTVDLPDDTDE